MKNCLLLGRTAIVLDNLNDKIDRKDIQLFSGTSLTETQEIFDKNDIDVVIMGAGLDIQDRIKIIEFIFSKSKSTTVHMKDWNSGPTGMLPFVNGILNAL